MTLDDSSQLDSDLALLAGEVAALPFPWPEAARQSRMRRHFESVIERPRRGRGIRRFFFAASAFLALGLGIAGATSRTPVDVVLDPAGTFHDLIGTDTSDATPAAEPTPVASPSPGGSGGGDDSGGNSGPGGGGDDDSGGSSNSGSGGSGS